MRRNVIDRMALLCTLHADGPRTLRLLREAGCTTIEKISKLPTEQLGQVLNLAPAAARRFTREAQHLHERLDPELECEEVTYPPAEQAVALQPAPVVNRVLEAELPQEIPRQVAREHLDLRDRQLLDRVVQRWRDEDPSRELPGTTGDSVEQEPEVVGEDLQVIQILGGEVQEVTERPASGLVVTDLEGLDEAACAALASAGVLTLETLATEAADDVAQRSNLTFTRVRTLQFLANRKLAETRKLAPEGEEEERISPREVPTSLELREFEGRTPEPTGFTPPHREERYGAKGPLEAGFDGGVAGPFA